MFRTEKIDAAVLPTLSDADPRELGLPLVDRKKLRAAIDALAATPLPAVGPRTASEQRHLTVMFCDLVDSTHLAATLDLEVLQGVVEAYQQQVATCVARYEGFVAKFMGDGVLVYFGYPQAHEDDAERAVRAALDIAAAMPSLHSIDSVELECRIGIASGNRSRSAPRQNWPCSVRRRILRPGYRPQPRATASSLPPPRAHSSPIGSI
jgi:class 3 adenylate cyclase